MQGHEAVSTAVADAVVAPESRAPITVTEGAATLHFASCKDVFYNYVQCTNRDLSMIMTKVFADIRTLEAAEKASRRKRTVDAAGLAPNAPTDPATTAAADLISSFGVGAAGHAHVGIGGDGGDGGSGGGEGVGEDGEGADAVEGRLDAAATAPRSELPAGGNGEPPPMRVLDALSASGLRALRYALEVPQVGFVLANDVSLPAVEAIRNNALKNGARSAAVIECALGDAAQLLYSHRQPSTRFDVVDLDPYGTAAPFLDGAVQAVSEGGMLAVTCTDMAVLCGNHGEACFAKYGAYPLRGKHCHESALRILLACIDSHAARHKRYIVPLLSVSVDFYVRVFVRVFSSASVVKFAASKRGYLYQCQGCEAFLLQRLGKASLKGSSLKFAPGSAPPLEATCEHCGRHLHVGGPLWAEALHDQFAVARALHHLAAGAPPDAQPPLPLQPAAPRSAPPAFEPPPAVGPEAPPTAGPGVRAQTGLRTHAQTLALAQAQAYGPSLAALASLPAPLRTAVPWATHRKLLGLLTATLEELPDSPLYVDLSGLCGILRCKQPPLVRFISALVARGHRVSRTHASPTGVKTDASWGEVWDVLRCWVAANPVKAGASEQAPGAAILAKPPSFAAQFEPSEAALRSIGRGDGIVRFPENPAADWGPGSKATAHLATAKRPAEGQAPDATGDGDEAGAAAGAQPESAMHAKRARNQGKFSQHPGPAREPAQGRAAHGGEQRSAAVIGGYGGGTAGTEGGDAAARLPVAPAGAERERDGRSTGDVAGPAAPVEAAQDAAGAVVDAGTHGAPVRPGGHGGVDPSATVSQSGPGH